MGVVSGGGFPWVFSRVTRVNLGKGAFLVWLGLELSGDPLSRVRIPDGELGQGRQLVR